ncbi:hypothetical protein [Rhizobium sp. Leaf453]|uniref:hypothetical protein n=1 Tax=Rhizobium sp. Leaf453 TaxID=1736380 RepID=UPI001FCCC52F|nr:hypothetical protein [Rhizobium sp. Leaf453]
MQRSLTVSSRLLRRVAAVDVDYAVAKRRAYTANERFPLAASIGIAFGIWLRVDASIA